ncbi:hypothetical protein GCM10010345_76240 [Streptomyces canarius]|uniref:Uncharacterized protein n=1 Tax=Streptomyces canarius TaxID=285453 RepID=A0ABQ3D6X7_9ACTN|nr:hypothetical protein GCM10010345_76240 [Streptomyces canarius]
MPFAPVPGAPTGPAPPRTLPTQAATGTILAATTATGVRRPARHTARRPGPAPRPALVRFTPVPGAPTGPAPPRTLPTQAATGTVLAATGVRRPARRATRRPGPAPHAPVPDRWFRGREPLRAAPRYPARHVAVTIDSARLATLGQ